MFEVRFRKSGDLEKAQGLVEFALILPVLLLSLFVLVELARVFHAWIAVENGARIGSRYAVTGELNETNCEGGGSDGKCTNTDEDLQARVLSIHEAAWAGSTSIMRLHENTSTDEAPSFFKVTVCQPGNLIEPASSTDTYHCEPEDPGGGDSA